MKKSTSDRHNDRHSDKIESLLCFSGVFFRKVLHIHDAFSKKGNKIDVCDENKNGR